jgi:hypothetical protein
MIVLTTKRYRRRAHSPRASRRPRLESLEARNLPSTYALLGETLLGAAQLGSLDAGGQATAAGAIGTGPAGPADVSWYSFHLNATEHVRLSLLTREIGSPLVGVLSLYNNAPADPISPVDYYTPTGWRLLAQDDAATHGGDAGLDRLLGAGDYWIAVSGSGDDYFSQTLGDSGLDGSTGPFQLSITTSDPGPAYDDPTVPVVLASDPAPGAVLPQSPFVLRFDLNTAIDPTTVTTDFGDPTATAQLWFNSVNDFSPTGSATQVDLSSATVSLQPDANELLIFPGAPLTAGYYEVTLQGYGPGGSNYVAGFQIQGISGNLDPTQQAGVTPGSAYDIPNATDGRLHQLTGAIGNDPTDPVPWDQNAIQYYHFSVTGGTYALDAEVFSGRIGSPLQPVLTLFQQDVTGQLNFVADNDGTRNSTPDAEGATPLYTDPALFQTLGPGEYYLAVGTGQNNFDPLNPGPQPFDPTVPDSGTAGNSTGPFVLNLVMQRPGPAPHIVAVTPDLGPNNGPLVGLQVRFDEPVNMLAAAYTAYVETDWQDGTLPSVTLTGPDNTSAALRLTSYDDATNTASFILLCPMPVGDYDLGIAGDGPLGITSLSGTPLDGNVALPGESRFQATFHVDTADSGTTTFFAQPGDNGPGNAQQLGVIFPVEFSHGITITRGKTTMANGPEDDYSMTMLQSRLYSWNVNGSSLPAGFAMAIIDPATGQSVASYTFRRGRAPLPFLVNAGTYVLRVCWSRTPGPYSIQIGYSGSPENPTPLVVGSGPALRVRLLTNTADGGAAAAAPAVAAAATATGPVTPAASGGSLPGAFTLPSSAVLAQAYSPLTGVAPAGGTDATAPGDRLVVRAVITPDATNALVSLLIVTQAPLEAAPEVPPLAVAPAPATGGGSQPAPPAETLTRMVDLLFEFWGWMNVPMPGPSVTPGAAPAAPAPDEGEEGLGATAPVRPADEREPDVGGAAWAWAWACALAAGGLALPERRRRARAANGGGPLGTP